MVTEDFREQMAACTAIHVPGFDTTTVKGLPISDIVDVLAPEQAEDYWACWEPARAVQSSRMAAAISTTLAVAGILSGMVVSVGAVQEHEKNLGTSPD